MLWRLRQELKLIIAVGSLINTAFGKMLKLHGTAQEIKEPGKEGQKKFTRPYQQLPLPDLHRLVSARSKPNDFALVKEVVVQY